MFKKIKLYDMYDTQSKIKIRLEEKICQEQKEEKMLVYRIIV